MSSFLRIDVQWRTVKYKKMQGNSYLVLDNWKMEL
jgi:hypothetical protein